MRERDLRLPKNTIEDGVRKGKESILTSFCAPQKKVHTDDSTFKHMSRTCNRKIRGTIAQ